MSCSTCQKEEKECMWAKYLIYVVCRDFKFIAIYSFFPPNPYSQNFRVHIKMVFFQVCRPKKSSISDESYFFSKLCALNLHQKRCTLFNYCLCFSLKVDIKSKHCCSMQIQQEIFFLNIFCHFLDPILKYFERKNCLLREQFLNRQQTANHLIAGPKIMYVCTKTEFGFQDQL